MSELSAEDRYQVRKLQMDVEEKELEVQKAQQKRDKFVLEMEHKYNLLTEGASIDPNTGAVVGAVAEEPTRNGKKVTQALLTAELQEAAA